jgi:hypothetical protein
MKKYIYLFTTLLFLLITGTMGFSQNSNGASEYSEKEIIDARSNIIKLIRSGSSWKANRIADTLYQLSTQEHRYLLLKEYLLVLYIDRSYDEVLEHVPENNLYLKEETHYPPIYKELQTNASLALLIDIKLKANTHEAKILSNTLLDLHDIEKPEKEQTISFLLDDLSSQKPSYPYYGKHRNTGDVKIALGSMYKVGFFSGELNDIYSSYKFYKPFFFGLHYKWFYFDMGASFVGIINKMDKGIVGITEKEGSFYGSGWDMFLSIGGEVYNDYTFAVTILASINALTYTSYYRERKMFQKPGTFNRSVTNAGNAIYSFGPGIFIDYTFWKFKKSSNNGMALRLRYDAYLWTYDWDFDAQGTNHQLSLGLMVLLFDE